MSGFFDAAGRLWSRLKNEDGFSLLEVMLSIAIITLVSGFILQMFVVSADRNRLTKDTDIAANVAGSAIETLKTQNFTGGFAPEELFPGAFAEKNSRGAEIYRCFGRDWNEIPMDSKDSIPKGAAFLQKTLVRTAPLYPDFPEDVRSASGEGGKMYEISSEVYAVGEQGDLSELAGFATKKYVPVILRKE